MSSPKQVELDSLKQLELDYLKQRIKETAANLAEMRKQLPAAIAAAKEEGGKPKKTLSPEHLAAMKAGREKKKAEKAASASDAEPVTEENAAPKKKKKAKASAPVEKVKDASESDSEKPKEKRKAAAGTLAWLAYVQHMIETRPEAFAADMGRAQKLTVIKGIRAADPSGYQSFVAEWKAL